MLPELPIDDEQRRLRWFVCLLLIAIFAGTTAARILTVNRHYTPAAWPQKKPADLPFFSANDRSRWCTVWALAERGTYVIDEPMKFRGWYSIDTKPLKESGRVISTKPPMLATTTAGLYWMLKKITGLDLQTQPHAVTRILLLLVNWLPSTLALVCLARLLDRYCLDSAGVIYAVALAACGTLVNTFQITLNDHVVAVYCVTFALGAALPLLIEGRNEPRGWVGAGVWSGLLVVNQLPAAVFAASLGLLLLRRDPRQFVRWYLPAAAVPLVVHFVMNYCATGGLLPAYADYGTALYNAYWQDPKGIDRNLDSPAFYFFNCIVGHHGILSLTPGFLLTLVGWSLLSRWEPRELRLVGGLGILCTIVLLAFLLIRTGNYNYGGLTSGLRWAFWLIPLWVLAIPPAFERFRDRRWFRGLAVAALAASVFSAVLPDDNPWQHPWLLRLFEQAGWTHYDG